MDVLAVGVGAIAIAALVRGAWYLVRETRLAVDTLEKRVERVQRQFAQRTENTR